MQIECTSKSHGSTNDLLCFICGQARVWEFGNFPCKHGQIGFSLGIPYLVEHKTKVPITITERHHNPFFFFFFSTAFVISSHAIKLGILKNQT